MQKYAPTEIETRRRARSGLSLHGYRRHLGDRWSALVLILPAVLAITTGTLAAQGPSCQPYTPEYPCIYVANELADSVSVINGSTNTLLGTIRGITQPLSLAVTPDNAFVYVSQSKGQLQVIDTKAGIVIPNLRIQLAGVASQLAISPTGDRVWVAESGCDGCGPPGVQVVLISSNTIDHTFDQFSAPIAVAVSPDGTTAYIADNCLDQSSNTMVACVDVVKVDPATAQYQVVTSINIPGSSTLTPNSIAVTPDGKLVCMSFADTNNDFGVAFIDPITPSVNSVFAKINGDFVVAVPSALGLGITSTGEVYAAAPTTTQGTALDDVYVFNTATQTFTGTVTVGTGPTGIAVLSDGQTVYVTNGGTFQFPTNTVSVIRSGVVIAGPIGVGKFPQGVAAMQSLPPVIITQPADQTIGIGYQATLSVQAAGTQPLTYQWYQGQSGDTSMPIPGATSATFTTPILNQDTSYWVQVSNIVATVNSATATVTVAPAPTCTLDLRAAGGSPLAITATATCTDHTSSPLPLTTTLNWGDNSPVVQVSGGFLMASHTYAGVSQYPVQVTATNTANVSGIKKAILDLRPITIQPPLVVFQGQSQSFTVTVSSPGPVKVNFECTDVVDSSGHVESASDLGINCYAISQPILLQDGVATQVTIVVQTSGNAMARVADPGLHEGLFYTCLLPVSGLVFMAGSSSLSFRRRKMRAVLALLGLTCTVVVSISCGGGFTAPHVQPTATPVGSYNISVVDVLADQSGNPGAFVQTTLIVPLQVVPFQ